MEAFTISGFIFFTDVDGEQTELTNSADIMMMISCHIFPFSFSARL